MYGTMDAVQVKMYGNPAKEFPTVVIDTFGDGKSTERRSNCKLSLDQINSSGIHYVSHRGAGTEAVYII